MIWKLIKDAPRDGRTLLLASVNSEAKTIYVGSWNHVHGCFYGSIYGITMCSPTHFIDLYADIGFPFLEEKDA